jgi:MFS transporter, SET family, sugar efflux transporter
MPSVFGRQPILILLAMLISSLCNSAIIPFMGYFIVEDLHMAPWAISLYAITASLLTMACTRYFGERIDRSIRIFPMMVISAGGIVLSSAVLSIHQSYAILLLISAPGIALSSAGVSSMFIFGRLYAEREGLPLARYNALMRSMTSTGWMFGPACSYLIADRFGSVAVFHFVFLLALAGWVTSFLALPRDFITSAVSRPLIGGWRAWFDNAALWAAAIFCFLFSLSSTLCSSTLPLYLTQELGLPAYTPGLSFTLKCAAEIIAITGSPALTAAIGRRNALFLSSAGGFAAYFLYAITSSVEMMMVAAFVEGLYFGIFAGVAIMFAQGFARGRLGRATSLYMNSLFLGSMTATTGMGLIASLFDFRSVLAAAALAMMGAMTVLYLTRRRDTEAET